jgi:hypothetical protein
MMKVVVWLLNEIWEVRSWSKGNPGKNLLLLGDLAPTRIVWLMRIGSCSRMLLMFRGFPAGLSFGKAPAKFSASRLRLAQNLTARV